MRKNGTRAQSISRRFETFLPPRTSVECQGTLNGLWNANGSRGRQRWTLVYFCLTVLVETDVGGLLTEALTADVHTVLADQTSAVRADTARAGALSVLAGPAEPNGLVSHLEMSKGVS